MKAAFVADNKMPQTSPIDLNHYRQLRAILRKHHDAVVKTVPRAALLEWAGSFGLLEGSTLLLKSDDELTILFDFLIYHHRRQGITLVQEYLASLPATDNADENVIRDAMSRARFSIYSAKETQPPAGVLLRDRVRGGVPLFVVDEALSTSVKPPRLFAEKLPRGSCGAVFGRREPTRKRKSSFWRPTKTIWLPL